MLVGLHRVGAGILKRVGPQLVEEPDPAPLLVQIDDDAAPLLRDAPHGGVELKAAIAPLGREDVAGQALRVHADHDVGPVGDVTLH